MRTRCCSTSRGITADLVESVADGRDDGRDQDLGVGVEHSGMVPREETLDEGESVDLHVAVTLIIA